MYETLQAIEPTAAVFPTPRLTKLIPRDRRRLSRGQQAARAFLEPFTLEIEAVADHYPDRLHDAEKEALERDEQTLAAVRNNFVEAAEYQKLERLRHDLEALQAELSAAEALAQTGLHKASAALEAGKDPAPAEKEYAKAKINVELLANRAQTIQRLIAAAQGDAQQALWNALEAKRTELLAEVNAAYNQALADAEPFFREIAPRLYLSALRGQALAPATVQSRAPAGTLSLREKFGELP